MLAAGLALFFGVHLVPMRPQLRARLAQTLGEKTYRGLFALVSLGGFVLLVIGKAQAPFVHVLVPPAFGRSAVFILMGAAAVCFAGMYLPTNLKRLTAHPMLWGTTFWALGHLLANGDQASLLLFGSFLVFALADMVSANRRGARPSSQAIPLWRDAVVLLLGLGLYVAALHGHQHLTGVRLVDSGSVDSGSVDPGRVDPGFLLPARKAVAGASPSDPRSAASTCLA